MTQNKQTNMKRCADCVFYSKNEFGHDLCDYPLPPYVKTGSCNFLGLVDVAEGCPVYKSKASVAREELQNGK